MGQHLAKLVLLSMPLGGCSLLYDPDRLPAAADAAPDMAIPPDPDNLVIESVAPSIIVEGAGVGGSRPALVVLTGKNFVPNNISVSIAVSDGSARTIMVDNAGIQVEMYGLRVAVPVTLPVDPMLRKGEVISLDVQVTQDGVAGPVKSEVISGKLALRGLDELTEVPAGGLVGGVSEYSQIAITTGTLTIAPNTTEPVILRSRSSVQIASALSVSAASQTGGPGGGRGGNGGAADLLNPGPGMAGSGPAGGQPSGGPGGFSNDDIALATLNAPNRGSGGAGGNGTTLRAGGAGGGGGGTIEVTAEGDLTVAAVSATGAPPQTPPGGGTFNAGGGGSGGVILLRAGGSLMSGAINVAGGGTAGGMGASGRARYDVGGTAMGPITGHFRGPSFVNLPLVTRSIRPELSIAGQPLSIFQYFISNDSGGNILGPFTVTTGAGSSTFTVEDDLHRGLNQICLLVERATLDSGTRNCFDLVYFQ